LGNYNLVHSWTNYSESSDITEELEPMKDSHAILDAEKRFEAECCSCVNKNVNFVPLI
jgi:hypothetical protein